MYTQVEKTNANRSRTADNSVTRKKSRIKQGFEFVDNRAEAIAQKKRPDMGNNSLQVQQLKAEQKEIATVGSPQFTQQAVTIQRYWILNEFGQYQENGVNPVGKFYTEPAKQWLSLSKGEATQANLAIVLQDAMLADTGGHIGTSDSIGSLSETYLNKPKQTVIDEKGLWMACWALAAATLQYTPIITFKSQHTTAGKKQYQGRGVVSYANINAVGWVIESGVLTEAQIKTIQIDQIDITAYLINDGTFQFNIGTLHWSIRA